MNLNRNTTPPIRQIEQISIPPIEKTNLSNGIPLYFLDMGEQEVSRIDIMVCSGKWQQTKPLVSSFTNLLVKEGAGNLTSGEIAEKLDFYGAWLHLSESYHHSYLTLYTLNRYFKETVQLLGMMLKEPHFPENEFNTLIDRYRQQFIIDNDKVQVLATRGFSQMLFGQKNPYGKSAELEDFSKVNTNDLKDFHRKYYQSGNIKIILSGKIKETQRKMIDEYFGAESIASPINEVDNNSRFTKPEIRDISSNHRRFIEKPDALQNGIRMGVSVVNRSHPDFPGLRVLNTILGGYFGSRLMSNIREEKGYTYGISSGISSLKYAAYLSIATQTACEHTENLIGEVYKEIDRLQTEWIGKQELDMVRNYMLGDFTRSLDGTFSLIDAYISLLANNMEVDFFHKQVETVKNITPEEIKRLAERYLKKDEFIEVIAGK